MNHLRKGILTGFLVASAALLVSSCKKGPEIAPSTNPPPAAPVSKTVGSYPVMPVTIKGDPSKFTHKSHEKRPDGTPLSCDECHVRTTNAAAPVFPGHSACIACHLNEFTNTGAGQQGMCVICHKNLDTIEAPMKAFSERKSYNVFFDPEQHRRHVAYTLPKDAKKELDCAFCHPTEKGGVFIGFPNHPECYDCHTFDAVKLADKNPHEVKPGALGPSSCLVCHPTAVESAPPPLKTKMAGNAFKYRFTHQSHGKISCRDCHNLNGSYNSTEVPQPKAAQHLVKKSAAGQGCFTCHNDKRAFGDSDASKCSKCHSSL